jgi:hypothetical protein
MPYLIGNCCADQIIIGNTGGGNPWGVINEPILFTNVATLDLPWNGTRIAKYGPQGAFMIEIKGDDGILRGNYGVEITSDDDVNPTNYHFDFGGISSGRITIS